MVHDTEEVVHGFQPGRVVGHEDGVGAVEGVAGRGHYAVVPEQPVVLVQAVLIGRLDGVFDGEIRLPLEDLLQLVWTL